MKLIKQYDAMMAIADFDQEAVEQFVESLARASKEDIVELLDHAYRNDDMAFPLWARLLCYRLAILQAPEDIDLLEDAGGSLLTHGGPDYDELAKWYLDRAKELRQR